MTGRSPLKQPGVPSKETAAEHARRIAKTRAAYASMSRRGGALHGALRPGSAASDRGAPRDPRPPFSSRETGVDSAAALFLTEATMADGASLPVSLSDSVLRIGGAQILDVDYAFGNGIVHVIDGVLTPSM